MFVQSAIISCENLKQIINALVVGWSNVNSVIRAEGQSSWKSALQETWWTPG